MTMSPPTPTPIPEATATPIAGSPTTPASKAPPFRMVSDFAPAGDQPKAIAQLAEGIERGERFQTLLGITGSGKSATIAWTIEQVQKPTLVHRPQQVAGRPARQRVPRVLPRQPGRVLRQLLRLLPARGLHPASSDTYIEKDSSINDEIDRLRHSATVRAAHPARRHRGGVGVVHLRPRLARGVPRATCSSCARASEHDQRADPPQAGRHALRAQRHEPRPRQVPGAGRHHRGPPGLRRDGRAHRAVRRRDRAHRRWSTRSPASSSRELDELVALPGHPLRRRRRAHAQGHRAHRGRAAGAAGLLREARASCSRRSACACARSTTSR